MTTTYLHLLTALTVLGDTADQAAKVLELGGWTGVPGQATECPVARYLTDVVPGVTCAAVSEIAITVWAGDDLMETVTPAGAAAFIDAFDDGRFPHLVEPDPADSQDEQ